MFLSEDKSIPIILHVHDEIGGEVDEDNTTAKSILHEAMSTCPPWAVGLSLAAETYEGKRYTK